jgi:rhamnulose-1-phosphate aldolase
MTIRKVNNMKNLISKCPGLEPIFADALEISQYLWDKGWAERNAGNLSVDVTELISDTGFKGAPGDSVPLEFAYPVLGNRYFLVTGTGRRFRDVAGDAAGNTCILRMSEEGKDYCIVWGGGSSLDFRPTSEFPTHLRLHEHLRKNKAPEKVVLHTHPPELIVLTHLPEYKDEAALNRALWCIHPEVKYNLPKGVGFVPYALPGSEALAQATAKGFSKGQSVVLWEMHGCVARAKEPMVAFDLIDIAAKAAAMVLQCRSAGHIPTGLTDEQIAELVREFNLEE